MVRRVIHTQSFINNSFIPSAYQCLHPCRMPGAGPGFGQDEWARPHPEYKELSGYAATSIAQGSQGRGCLLLTNVPRRESTDVGPGRVEKFLAGRNIEPGALGRRFTKYEQTEDARNRENGGVNVVYVWKR